MSLDVQTVASAVAACLMLTGAAFLLIGALGLVRFKDFFMRLHAPTKASTLGLGGVLLASLCIHWSKGTLSLHELLITLFVFCTAPVSANLMAKAALHQKVPSQAGHEPVEGVGDASQT